MAISVLIVEDDKELLKLLKLDLEVNGYRVITAEDGLEGLRMFKQYEPDLLVLDVSLPRMDGITVCQKVRETSDVPILIMTAHAISETEIANGLNMGADEYMIKPLPNIEFHARVRALLRRSRLLEDVKEEITRYQDDYLSVNLETRRVYVGSQEIRLTPTEFKLLSMFIQHQGEVLTFLQLLENVWGVEYKNEHHYPRIYVSHLRRKIEPDLKYPTYIHNEYGIGYRFVGKLQTV
ncbi:MAG: response regulator transcription factor [Anaerolineae bacterium]|jgi:two-component system KDP operon response regulator KdpE|nr:response regulator transcription factor [Anaerolineae bacterium]